MATPLDRELATYEREKARLLKEHEGKYVLIIRDLKIKPVGTGTSLVVGATEVTTESTYRLGIGVETLAGHTGMKLALISDALVFGDIELGNIDCLLGMDILGETALFINGPE